MKLRQKLAVVLASAMVVTAVPVVTMAASTAKVSKTITVANEDALGDKAPWLEIELKDDVTSGTQFYITLENAKFDKVDDEYVEITEVEGSVTVTPISDTEAVVKFTDDVKVETDKSIKFQLNTVKVTGEAKISIDGNETEVSDQKDIIFANKIDSKAAVTVGDKATFYQTSASGDAVADIVLTESVSDTLKLQGTSDEERTIVIEMENDDFTFAEGDVTLVGGKGFAGVVEAKASVEYVMGEDDKPDESRVTIVLPELTGDAAGKGTLTIKGLKVISEKNPEMGDVEVYIKAGDVSGDETALAIDATTVTVAEVVDYGTELTVDEKDDVKAGKSTTVKVTYKETTSDSIAKGDVDFVLDEGYFTAASVDKIAKSDKIGSITKIYAKDSETDIIGFTLNLRPEASATTFLDGFELEVETTLGMEGDITLSTTGRYVEDQEVVIATVAPSFEFSGEAMTLKVGQTKQVGGKLVITELEKGAIERHGKITISLPKDSGIKFTNKPEVTIDGDAKVETSDIETSDDGSSFVIELDKVSKEAASTITIEGFEVSVDRTVPQGTYEIEVNKIDGYKGSYTQADFFVVGTPNEEELAANGLPKGTAEFVIGSTTYTVNGVTKVMDGAAYLEPGYTMVPVRYVAEALGVDVRDILFSNGKVTIFAGARTIQLTIGSNVAMVNGAPIDMAEAVVSKDDRTYAPMGEIARILGVETSWDGSTQTAKFLNK